MDRKSYGEITEGAEQEIGFYLTDNFSLLPFVAAVEPLRIANRMSRKPLYQWSIVTGDGNPDILFRNQSTGGFPC